MSKNRFKTAGIARSGFEYQDLIGIELLLKFYRDPDMYYWVQLECEDKGIGKLDDVVAARRDGSFELLQVKFTVDPLRYFLDWSWLLTRTGGGTSLLTKWSSALIAAKNAGPVHSAKLRTNRRADAEFAAALNGARIDFDKIDPARRSAVSAELGGDEAARAFFSEFEFVHSEALIDDLEIRLRGEIVPTDTDNTGWLLLREQARKWAILKKYPEPDGKVQHHHLVQLISKRRPKPIPQDFEVPALYQLPAKAFHDGFMARIGKGVRPISVLWGTPGRGKSTYLSYLVDLLRSDDQPAVRHHYFLSLDDSTADRVSFTEICHSLMHQMSVHYADAVRNLESDPNQIKKWLEACGSFFSKEGKRFFVVIDGLDHVWREQRNTSQMEHLFNYLLPCPPNVFLVIGTQKVAAAQLPLRLIQNAMEEDWVEVPPMDEGAVHGWLKGQREAGCLLLRDGVGCDVTTELADVARAFYETCGGNPLHLIYSFEALVRRGVIATVDEVRSLPSCPDGDIRKYYSGLWTRLGADAKKVIHLIAGSDFQWPADGLRSCAGALDEVDHLLIHRRTGVIPFHGSILAYVRDQNDHQSVFKSLLPGVVTWLDREASDYLRWAWLWIMRARSGDASDLLSNATRQWVIKSLAAGWPTEQIVIILHNAEEWSFLASDYNKTLELRSLKIRVQNGEGFQTDRFNDFTESAIRLSGNQQQILNLADAIPFAADDDLVTLLRCVGADYDKEIGEECFEALRTQINRWITVRHRPNEEFLSLAENFLEGLVAFRRHVDVKVLLRFINQFDSRDRLYHAFLRQVVRQRRFELAVDMLDLLQDEQDAEWRSGTQDAMVRIASAEGIDLPARLTKQSTLSPLLTCWFRLKGLTPSASCDLSRIAANAVRSDYEYGPNIDVEQFFHATFFALFDVAVTASGDCQPALVGIDRKQLGWMEEGIQCLWKAASEAADVPADIGFDTIFIGLADLKPVAMSHRPSEPDQAQYRAFRRAIRQIAADLHSLRRALTGPCTVPAEKFEVARGSTHWDDSLWIAEELEARTLIIDPRGVKNLVDELAESEADDVTQFNERAERWIDLAQLSMIYGLEGGERFVERAADCIIGYGWRKDVWIFDVLSSIGSIHDAKVVDVVPWLERLAPIIAQIEQFTDGDETNHAPEEFIELVARVKPEWLPGFYSRYIAAERWRLAECAYRAILRNVDFSSATGGALGRTVIERFDLDEIESLRDQQPEASGVWLNQRRFVGATSGRTGGARSNRKARRKKEDWEKKQGKPPDVKKYVPEQFASLLRRLSSHKHGYLQRDATLHAWLKYWDQEGRGLDAIRAIDAHFKEGEKPSAVDAVLDDAFEISLKHEGKTKAYTWLVRAQIERRGWSDHWDRDEHIQRRFDWVAKLYPAKWEEFIRDASKLPSYWEKRGTSLTIGTRSLVSYLLTVGQSRLAAEYTGAMVRILEAEVADQPLRPLELS